MSDRYAREMTGLSDPGIRHWPIVPADGVELSPRPRVLWVKTAGTLAVRDMEGTVVIYEVDRGSIFPFRAWGIDFTGTSAEVVGWD